MYYSYKLLRLNVKKRVGVSTNSVCIRFTDKNTNEVRFTEYIC